MFCDIFVVTWHVVFFCLELTCLNSLSISMSSRISMHLSSSGMWRASMEMASSQSIDQPRISESLSAWTWSDWLGTLAHWWGFRHWTLSLGGNWGMTWRSEFWSTAADRGKVVEVRPSSICKISLLVASTNIAGNNFVSGSILNLWLVSLPSHVKDTQPVTVSTKQPTNIPCDAPLPDASCVTSL